MTDLNRNNIYIGTSNIVLPGNKNSYPPEYRNKTRLAYYSHLFNSLEVNSSFYKIPQFSTFQKWSQEVPNDFKFSVKIYKEITHAKKLQPEADWIHSFIKASEGASKKGGLLIQFPGSITLAYFREVEQLLTRLKKEDKNDHWKKAIEFRHPSWYISETAELIKEFNASLVWHDMQKGKIKNFPDNLPFYYFRYHGPEGHYRGTYPANFIKAQAKLIHDLSVTGKKIFVYFNNSIGEAFNNARLLQSMIFNLEK